MMELSPQQAMEHTVRQARAQLADGAMVQGTLEHVWRLAFAAGVRAGQAPIPPSQRSQPWAEGVEARKDGWKYGVALLGFGDRFIYGGVDREKPVCARQATLNAAQAGRNWMTLHDTAERVRLPGMCWWRPVTEEKADADK